jgi:protocatechuate 3,4-dioxygenase beta subunit
MKTPPIRRREAAAFIALPLLASGLQRNAGAQTAPPRPTPAQTEGPFYPVALPKDSDFDLLHNGSLTYARGEPAWVEGSVADLQGRPVGGAVVEIWQCDGAGHYHHPGDGGRADPAFQGFGRVTVGADGRYRFRTIRPVPYTGRTPHIHFKVRLRDRELLTTQLYVAGDPHNERDGIWRRLSPDERAAVTVPFRAGPDGMRAEFPIVVAA